MCIYVFHWRLTVNNNSVDCLHASSYLFIHSCSEIADCFNKNKQYFGIDKKGVLHNHTINVAIFGNMIVGDYFCTSLLYVFWSGLRDTIHVCVFFKSGVRVKYQRGIVNLTKRVRAFTLLLFTSLFYFSRRTELQLFHANCDSDSS